MLAGSIMGVIGFVFLLVGGRLTKSGIKRNPMLMSSEEINKLETPETITKKIKAGWIAAVVSGVMTPQNAHNNVTSPRPQSAQEPLIISLLTKTSTLIELLLKPLVLPSFKY